MPRLPLHSRSGSRFGIRARPGSGWLAACVASGLTACLFDSGGFVPEPRHATVALDSLYPAGHAFTRTVDLYQPLLDASLPAEGAAAPEALAPVNVKIHGGQTVIRYRLTRQRFGSWSAGLEFKWNYFLLQSMFIFQDSLPDTAGLAFRTSGLYEAVKKTDRYTRYYDSASAPGAWESLNSTTQSGAVGIEVGLNGTEDTVMVRRVVAGSPAFRSGLKPGMAILAVDDSSVTGDSAIDRFSRFIGGDSGEAVTLRLLGPEGSLSRSMVREPVAFPTVYADSLEGLGYISISGFMPSTVGMQSTYTEFTAALRATRRFPVTLVDLRDNPGGSLDLTIRMCDEILPAGAVIIRQRQRMFSEEDHVPLLSESAHLATSAGSAEGRKFVLLANRGSASAAEIFLLALREGAGAPIVGDTTFGKGVGQNVRGTPGQGLALVTFLKFTGRSGLEYHQVGVVPDYLDQATGDRLLLRALAVAKAGLPAAAKQAYRGDAGPRRRAQALEWNRQQRLRWEFRDR